MKTFLLITLIAFGINARAQITLEHRYKGTNNASGVTYLSVVHLTGAGYLYQLIDEPKEKISLYNLNHSLYKTIQIPPQPKPSFGFQLYYLSDELFNTNPSDIEYMIWNRNSSNNEQITIYGEAGNVLFNIQDTINYAITNIMYTTTGVKMMLYNPFGDSSGYVYSLPGKLPCSDCTNGAVSGLASYGGPYGDRVNVSNPYPNPSNSSTRIDYILPDGVNQGEIVFYDLHGKEIKKFIVDRAFDHLLVSTSDIPAGTYYYQLRTAIQNSGGKKLVLIK